MAKVNKGHRALRAELESAALELVAAETDLPMIALRIEQAIRRGGLGDLLSPALSAVERAGAAVRMAKDKVTATASQLDERR